MITTDCTQVTSTFPAMGNTAHISIAGTDPHHLDSLMATAQVRLAQLESRWSRFVANSDVSRLNTSAGEWIAVTDDTAILLHHMKEAYRVTDGRFNPFLLPALLDAGYSASLTGSDVTTSIRHDAHIGATADDVHTVLHEGQWYACLTNCATVDPGGIGKGLAADMTAELLMERGATGALVSVGGDLRCIGTPPTGDNWVIAVAHTDPDPDSDVSDVDTVQITAGGVATSTTHAKRWYTNGSLRHHVISPDTARPLDQSLGSLRAATVLASSAAWAEVFATAALIGGLSLPTAHRLATRIERIDGTPLVNEEWKKHSS